MKLDKNIEEYRKDILAGRKGLMPITSNKITIVWVHSCGHGRMVELDVDDEGRKQFEAINKECKEQYEKYKKSN